jgi:hypothetical protein
MRHDAKHPESRQPTPSCSETKHRMCDTIPAQAIGLGLRSQRVSLRAEDPAYHATPHIRLVVFKRRIASRAHGEGTPDLSPGWNPGLGSPNQFPPPSHLLVSCRHQDSHSYRTVRLATVMPNQDLRIRVVRAAETALSRQQYVSTIDVLCGMGLLAPTQVDAWRKGRIDCLDRVIQGNPSKISSSIAIFRQWAQEQGLQPSETGYVRTTRSGTVALQFSESADPNIEKIYRTHYVSPALSEPKRQQLEEKLNRAPQPVVFQILRDSRCTECGADIEQDSFLLMEAEQPLCLSCAGLADLEFLPSGEAALTRRATKYSQRAVVVVRFSRSRGRYERQGILVETAALEKAERECLEDADERAAARLRGAERRREQDRALVVQMATQIGILFPGCPPGEVAAIAQHTAVRGSGRVGRTEAGRALAEDALTAAVVAAVRHKHTKYDELLANGMDRTLARQRVADRIEEILAAWRN